MAKIRLPDPAGCDIVVWQKTESSPTYFCGYTAAGTRYLRKSLNPEYDHMQAITAKVAPEEFLSQAPKGLKIGCVPPGEKKTVLMQGGALH